MHRHRILALAAAGALAAVPAAAQDMGGHAMHGMYVLPGPSSTSTAQRAYAQRLLTRVKREAYRWRTRALARADGYRPGRSTPDIEKHTFHYNNTRRYRDGRRLDPRRPESLVYRQVTAGHFRLVALMFRIPVTMHPPHPAGGLMRWHVHYACEMSDAAMPTADNGPCPDGMRMRTGPTAMVHVWFVDDLTHAFDLMAPSDDLLHPEPLD